MTYFHIKRRKAKMECSSDVRGKLYLFGYGHVRGFTAFNGLQEIFICHWNWRPGLIKWLRIRKWRISFYSLHLHLMKWMGEFFSKKKLFFRGPKKLFSSQKNSGFMIQLFLAIKYFLQRRYCLRQTKKKVTFWFDLN